MGQSSGSRDVLASRQAIFTPLSTNCPETRRSMSSRQFCRQGSWGEAHFTQRRKGRKVKTKEQIAITDCCILDIKMHLCYAGRSMIDVQNTHRRIDWEECPRDTKQSRWQALHAAMYPDGVIAITRFTHEQLGSPECYVLKYSRDLHIVGLTPSN